MNHTTCTSVSIDPACSSGNAIHILNINSDGTLTEPATPPFIFAPTRAPNDTHPKGLILQPLGPDGSARDRVKLNALA